MGIMDVVKSAGKNRMTAIASVNSKSDFKNEFYYPSRNKDGVANVVIRFLPQKDLNKIPYVTKYSHFFKGSDGRWCIMDLCPTTLGINCPVCTKNSELWQTGLDENKAQASAKKRKKDYICNVLIVKDPENPEKEGTVQLFKFGPMIYKLLIDVMQPKFEDEEPLDPFDILEGADFNLRIIKDETKNQITYERSKFLQKSVLFNGDEEKIKELIDKLHDLDKYIDESLLLSPEAMDKFMEKAYGTTQKKKEEKTFVSEPERPKQEVVEPEFPTASASASDDDILNEFRNLIES